MKLLKNYHAFKVTFLPWTTTKPNRVKVYSERFKEGIILSRNEAIDGEQYHEQAARHLDKLGYNVKGIAQGTGCFYIFSTTFLPLKK